MRSPCADLQTRPAPHALDTRRPCTVHPTANSSAPRWENVPGMSVFSSRRPLAALAVAAMPLALLTAPSASTALPSGAGAFDRVATYPVHLNLPAGVDPATETVAEISAVTPDGRTMLYTDALGKRIGFLDISVPSRPVGVGSIELATLGHADDQPTSVAIVGDHALITIDETGGDFTEPRGSVKVIRLADRSVVRSIDLGGQPDSIVVTPDGRHAAIAIENQRDEELTPPGLEEGDIPQAPAGFVQLLDLDAGNPEGWALRTVPLTAADGSALPALTNAGLAGASDPEPEYVAANAAGKIALTLQENNGIAIIDAATGALESVFSAGSATVEGIDTTKDGMFDPTGAITAPREPDAIAWVDEHHVATANEGDWLGGTRGWTVFDIRTGEPVWDAGNSFERIATSLGLHNNDRAGKKGAEPEGLTVATVGGKRRAFVGSERSNFVAVYDLSDPANPVFEQVLPTTNGPEGLLAIPERDLFVVSSETDEAAKGVRATVGLYEFGDTTPAFPGIVSTPGAGADDPAGAPIGWGALSGLSAAPGEPGTLWAVSDAAYAQARLYEVDVTASPARIEGVVTVRSADGRPRTGLDLEGVSARAEGGFWVASEGANGDGNRLLRLDAEGVVREEVALPAEVAAQVGKWGLEGVSASGSGADEVLYAVLQRPLFSDVAATTLAEADVARIGRYQVATGTWTWFTYPLSPTAASGDWVGLSEVTLVDSDTLAVVERDKLNGPRAAIKQVYTVDLPSAGGSVDSPVALTKDLAIDVLPHLRATGGWTQEKLEGLTIGADGTVYAVTDNDGLVDATGETAFLRLGAAADLFATLPDPVTPTPTPGTPTPTPSVSTPVPHAGTPSTSVKRTPTRTKLTVTAKGRRVTAKVRVAPGGARGVVRLLDRGKVVRTVKLRDGRATVRLNLTAGKHRLVAKYVAKGQRAGSRSAVRTLVVR